MVQANYINCSAPGCQELSTPVSTFRPASLQHHTTSHPPSTWWYYLRQWPQRRLPFIRPSAQHPADGRCRLYRISSQTTRPTASLACYHKGLPLNPKLRQALLNLSRVAISAGLLGFIIYYVGPAKILAVARTADLRLFALAIALVQVGVVVRAYRWQILLNAVGARVPFRRAVYLYFVGSFFNTFLPTGFGGDVVRVIGIGQGATSEQAAGTAVVDRLTGFIVLFLLALVALPFSANLLEPRVALLIVILAGSVVAGSALLFEGRWLRWLIGRFAQTTLLTGHARLNQVYRAILTWIEKTYGVITACGARALAGAMFWSLVFNLIQMGANCLVGQALGINVSPWVYFLFIPVATATLLVPATISGFGAREAVYIVLFGQLRVGSDLATTFSLGSYFLDFASGVTGGVIYLISGLLGFRPQPQAARP
jgi:glycosyltransferase 2 family protein